MRSRLGPRGCASSCDARRGSALGCSLSIVRAILFALASLLGCGSSHPSPSSLPTPPTENRPRPAKRRPWRPPPPRSEPERARRRLRHVTARSPRRAGRSTRRIRTVAPCSCVMMIIVSWRCRLAAPARSSIVLKPQTIRRSTTAAPRSSSRRRPTGATASTAPRRRDPCPTRRRARAPNPREEPRERLRACYRAASRTRASTCDRPRVPNCAGGQALPNCR